MDLNDPRRRLQVLNQANPSLRVSVAPSQPKVTIAQPSQPQRIQVPQSAPAPVFTKPPTPKKTSFWDKVSSFSDTAADKIGGGIGRGVLRSVDFVLPGKNTFNLEKVANEWDKRAQQSAAQQNDQGAAKAGAKFGSVVKGVADVAGLAAGSTAAETAASKIPAFAGFVNRLAEGGKVAQVASKALSIIPGSLGGSAADIAQTAGRGDKQNVLKSAGIGLAGDLALPAIGAGLKKGFNVLRGDPVERFVGKLAKSEDVEKIASKIKKVIPGADEKTVRDISGYISKENNPDSVRAALSVLENNQQLPEGIYSAQSPRPSSLPEGMVPPHQAGTPNDRFPRSGQQTFAPITPETQTRITDLEQRAMQTPRKEGTTRVFQVSQNGGKSDWVFNDADSLANWINTRETPDMKLDFYDVPNNRLKPTPNGEHVFQVEGGVNDLAKQTDSAEGLRFTDVNKNAKEAIKNPELATSLSGKSADPLTSIVDAMSRMDNPSSIRKVVGDLMPNMSDGQQKRLAEKLAKAKSVDEVTNLLDEANGVRPGVKATQEGLDANVQKVTPPPTEAAQVEQTVAQAPTQSGVSDAAVAATPSPTENVGDTVAKNADQAATQQQSAADLFPDADPESQSAIQEVMDSLGKAKTEYNKAAKGRKQETAIRSQAGNAAFDAAGGGQAGFKAEMAAQRGKKAESGFEPIMTSQKAKDDIINDLKDQTDMMDWERRNTYNAFQKLWGDVDGKPAPHDIRNIKNYLNKKEAGLGDEAEKLIKEAMDSGESLNMIEQLAGAPRTLMTIGDASAPRQLAVSFGRHPVVTTKAYLESFGQMFSGKKFNAATEKLSSLTDEAGKNYSEFMDSVMNLHLPNVAEKAAEESMSSAPLLSKIPVVGKVVEGSNRGMSAAVAKTRFDLAKKFIDDNGGIEATMQNFSKKDLADLGEVLNTITGRGGKAGGFTDKHATILSKTLFSGKLWASRVNMLNPYWYYRLSPAARKEAISAGAAFAAQAGTVLYLIDKLPGVDVGADPTSADFGKIKVGNTRYDILGGFQQNIRVAAQIATGKRTNSITGESKETTPASVLGGLIEGKANPLLGYAYKMLSTTDDPNSDNPFARVDEWGNSINSGKEAAKLAVPLPVSGVAETMKDQGNVKGFAMSLPGFFGAGTQTYGDVPTKDQGKTSTGTPTFKGKVTPDMVLDDNGQPMLDSKGKVVKVKFDKNATETQKKAAFIEAKNRTYTEKAKSLLSPEDADIYAMGEADKNQLDNTQLQKYNQIKKWVSDYGRPVDVPREVTSDGAKNFYQKWNSMTKDDQQAWLKEAPDENANTLAGLLNKERTQGLSEFKPSNELSKAYAEYEKDINSHPEYTAVDKRNKAKAFQSYAYKLNYSNDQRDIYNEGSSADLRTLIDNKQISKDDLNAAIKMDDELYNSGLTGSLKFSKKFREEFGFGLPDGGGTNKDPNASSKSKKTYINDLVPNISTSGPEKPTFSSKPRTKGLSFNVNLPKKAGNPKQIKL